jgi:CheY-like chemotaxis protein
MAEPGTGGMGLLYSEAEDAVDLHGRRILIVEDEQIVALDLELTLRTWGGTVVGPATTVSRAVEMARSQSIDGAMVDINLCGAAAFPALDILLQRGVPVILATSYPRESLPAAYRNLPILPKPYDPRRFSGMVQSIFSSSAREGSLH